jgi:Anti-sigma factor NepR
MHNPLRSEATMHTDAQVRRPGGRLSREDQRRIGDILQRVYDEVLRQGVPDRFKELVDRFERPGGDTETRSTQGQDTPHHEPDRMVGAKAFDNKGSRS